MPGKQDAAAVMRKQVGEKKAEDIFAKVEKMLKEKASAEDIEKAVAEDLTAYIEKVIAPAVRSEVEILMHGVAKPIVRIRVAEIRGRM